MRTRLAHLPITAFLLFLLSLALRCYGLTAPLLDYHSWRQADTAAIARNYTTNDYKLLYPQVDWGGRSPGFVETEFPLYSYSLALLYGLFGVHVWMGRLLTALCGAAAVVALYGLALQLLSGRVALYAGVALAIMPFPVYFGRAVMPDTLMLLTAILAIWTCLRWLEYPSMQRLVAMLVCGALAPLAKTPNLLIVGIPLAYLILRYRPPRHVYPALAAYAVCFVAPVLMWMYHARSLPSEPWLSFGIGEKLLDLRLLTDPQFYVLLGRSMADNIVTIAGIPFLVLGLWSRQPPLHPFPWLPHAWLLGVLIFLCIGAAGVVGQDYYILPLAAPAALLLGSGLDRAEQWLGACGAVIWRRIVPPLGLLSLAVLSFFRLAPLYQTTDFYQTLGRRVDLALPPGAQLGVIAPAVSEILYYGERRGWRLDPGVLVPGGLSSLRPDLGIRYVLICDPWLSERREVLTEALYEFRRVPIGPYALLFDLEQPGLSEAAELVWETGHLVKEPFLSAWKLSPVPLGYPLSEAMTTSDGRVQYFERGLLLLGDHGVIRAPIGHLLMAAQGYTPRPTDVAEQFQDTWHQFGALDGLGAPIAPAVQRADRRWEQYFEYGILEQIDGHPPSLASSGRTLLDLRGLSEERQIELAAR